MAALRQELAWTKSSSDRKGTQRRVWARDAVVRGPVWNARLTQVRCWASVRDAGPTANRHLPSQRRLALSGLHCARGVAGEGSATGVTGIDNSPNPPVTAPIHSGRFMCRADELELARASRRTMRAQHLLIPENESLSWVRGRSPRMTGYFPWSATEHPSNVGWAHYTLESPALDERIVIWRVRGWTCLSSRRHQALVGRTEVQIVILPRRSIRKLWSVGVVEHMFKLNDQLIKKLWWETNFNLTKSKILPCLGEVHLQIICL